MQLNSILQKIFKYLTPCTICIVVCLFNLALSFGKQHSNNGWADLGRIAIIIAVVILSIITIVTHLIFKEKLWQLWVSEILAIILVIYFF